MMLADLQSDFRRWLTSASADAAGRLGGGASVGADAGLAVYQNNYRAQLVGCLRESYPRLRAFLGEERFLHAATVHIGARPPHAWTLDAYADEFGETLQALFPHNPDLHELAWIEHALSAAFVAPDARPLAPAALAAVDWEQARLRFSPTLRLAPLATNASDIWWAAHAGLPAPEAQMLPGACGMMVWRRGYVSSLRVLDALDFDALMLASGNCHGEVRGGSGDGSFGALCGMLVGRLGEAEGVAKAGALLADWIGSELIIGLDKRGAGHA